MFCDRNLCQMLILPAAGDVTAELSRTFFDLSLDQSILRDCCQIHCHFCGEAYILRDKSLTFETAGTSTRQRSEQDGLI